MSKITREDYEVSRRMWGWLSRAVGRGDDDVNETPFVKEENKMEEVIRYRANDGREFNTSVECEEHESLSLKNEYYMDHPLFNDEGNTIRFGDLKKWFINNRDFVHKLTDKIY